MLGRTGLRYEWGSQSAIRNISINLQGEGEDSLADGRWHSVNIEHNSLEVSLVLDRNNVATSSHNIKMTESRQLSNSYYLMVSSGLSRAERRSHRVVLFAGC